MTGGSVAIWLKFETPFVCKMLSFLTLVVAVVRRQQVGLPVSEEGVSLSEASFPGAMTGGVVTLPTVDMPLTKHCITLYVRECLQSTNYVSRTHLRLRAMCAASAPKTDKFADKFA